ncbi:U4/U6 x U5 tri-snRNP complex subunit Prp1 [Tieghemiomyces parasiticus]|uniref:U4/U6 x U5 tri-snRNP complex subunit Prp1 n=1 Tax=Tieghemiomyces parasiticus TaxID=78921 RepID=A0A9W8AIJ4_9FUNG|nr:U4/U6 x U5 tri-snRNP complex subunit Prp1 [Tieghemiomyces parasiticus]
MFNATKDFLGKPAPPNYVAGLGRGATGFTTRSDIGPAREGPDSGPAGGTAGRGRGAATAAAHAAARDETEAAMHQDPDNMAGLFSTLPYERDDEEADKVYAAIDAKMEERRQKRRTGDGDQDEDNEDAAGDKRPRIHEQFSDLKRQLAAVTEDEWSNLPEVGDLVGKSRSKGRLRNNDPSAMRFTPVPDNALLRGQASRGLVTTLDPAADGLASGLGPGDATTGKVDLVELGQARKHMLGLQLDRFSDSAAGSSTVDPRGYITGLNSLMVQSNAEVADIKRARTLLHAVTSTNPKHAPGWIAAARLEEVAGKLQQARAVIGKGCDACPLSEDVWLEAARLHPTERAKTVLSEAVKHLPQSVRIWLQAVQLETDPKLRKRVIRRALELVPNSVKLWKTAVSLEEDPTNARILLSRAVELVPLAAELWLALARLETYDNARKVLNRARKAIPTSHEIWLAGAQLEEQQPGEPETMVKTVIERAVHVFSEKGNILNREQWLKEAVACERDGYPLTCQAIVAATLTLDLDPEDQESTWIADAEQALEQGAVETARALFAHAIRAYPTHEDLWLAAADLERKHGTPGSLDALLKRAVKYCPQTELFWLMGAKELWLVGRVDAAREILGLAFDANPDSEQIWLAAIKLEMENRLFDNARLLLAKARVTANTAKIWMKAVQLERITNDPEAARALLTTALAKFPKFDKLWMIKGQLDEERNDLAAAREAYRAGMTRCPAAVPLWRLAARLEERAGVPVRARALLERGRLLNPRTPTLWLDAIHLETRQSGPTSSAMSPATKLILSKALQECPHAGILWAEAIFLDPRPQRKGRSVDAMKQCPDDPVLMTAIARLFWSERKLDKARTWFERALKLDSDAGDTWAWWYKLELLHGTPETQQKVREGCAQADPHHGELWQPIAKDVRNFGIPVEEKLAKVAETIVPPK